MIIIIVSIPYGGKLWRGENLANQAKYHCWQNKIWRIVSKAHDVLN